MSHGDGEYAKGRSGVLRLIGAGVLMSAGAVAVLVLFWKALWVFLLAFAAIVVSRIFAALAGLLSKRLHIPSRASLPVAAVLIAIGIGIFGLLAGTRIRSEIMSLMERLPQSAETVLRTAGISKDESSLTAMIHNSGLVWNVIGFTSNAFNIATAVVIVVAAGIFLAASPGTYRNGALALVPPRFRGPIGRALDASGRALGLWLVAKLMMMAIVFAAITPGLYLIGVPYALTLGITAGLLEFIPFVGPIIAAIPALLIALSEGGTMIYWVAGLFLVVQQIENNVLIPLIQQRTVEIPPVLSLFAILLFSALSGPLGLVLAIPLTVVLMVFVKQLYIRDLLGEETHLPGETGPPRDSK